jgi:hypothetical protein
MTVSDASAEAIGFVAWAQDEALEPAWLPTSADTYTQPSTYAEPRLRVLPDGSPQLTLRNSAGARVVRLGTAPVQVTAEFVRDAVMTPDGNVVLLDQIDVYRFNVRCVTPDATVLWSHSFRREPSDRGVARLLTDSDGRVFAETTTVADPERRELGDEIGADGAGRVYWRGPRTIARTLPDGETDWLVDIGGITVSEGHDVTVLTYGANGRVARFDNGGRVSVDMPPEDMGRLVGRGDDGEYILHRLIWTNKYRKPHGQLTYLDRSGRRLRTELAPDDIWLTMDIAQRPDFSSVTADGEVLVAVTGKLGVHVVRLTPGSAVKEGD